MQKIITGHGKLAVFNDKAIRRTFHNNEWWFSVVDVVGVLTDSSNSRRYWSDLKRKLTENEGYFQLYEEIVQLKIIAPDGKMRETDCANTESIFRAPCIVDMSFPRRRESRKNKGWIPACAGMTLYLPCKWHTNIDVLNPHVYICQLLAMTAKTFGSTALPMVTHYDV